MKRAPGQGAGMVPDFSPKRPNPVPEIMGA